jgi:hypothetical protein
MGLYHPLDGITNLKYKLVYFLTPNKKISNRKALAFNQDRCCHLAICLQLILFHCVWWKVFFFENTKVWLKCLTNSLVLLNTKFDEIPTWQVLFYLLNNVKKGFGDIISAFFRSPAALEREKNWDQKSFFFSFHVQLSTWTDNASGSAWPS